MKEEFCFGRVSHPFLSRKSLSTDPVGNVDNRPARLRDPVEMESTLDDGTRVLFRPISPEDKQRLQQGLQRLSPGSRYMRFFRHVDRFTDRELRYLTEVDMIDHVAWVALLPDEDGQPGIGVARWIRMDEEPALAEGAVTVIDDYQGRGVGSMLLYLAARSALERGIRAFRVYALGDNHKVMDLMRDLGAIAGKWEGGVLELTVPLERSLEELERSAPHMILKAVARGELEDRN
jgi:GNAT superfamily N-acetyltransferase